jgi:enoyl-CoA hydratase
MEMIITGRVIDADEAHQIGLVNEVVPRGRSLQRAIELAHVIAELPGAADRQGGSGSGVRPTAGRGLRIEAQCFNRSISAPDTVEGLRQFRDRDNPDRRPDQPPITPGPVRT